MQFPTLVVNLKQHIVGSQVKEYVEFCKSLDKEMIICVATADLLRVKGNDKVKIFAQKYDLVSKGDSKTGSVCIDSLECDGSLLNHFESRIYGEGYPEEKFTELIELIRKGVEKNLQLIVCVDNVKTGIKLAAEIKRSNWNNIGIAVEWDEYIGKRISMIQNKPEEIESVVSGIGAIDVSIPLFCGAGVEKAEDILKAKEMGMTGILAATGFTKAPNYNRDYKKALKDVFEKI